MSRLIALAVVLGSAASARAQTPPDAPSTPDAPTSSTSETTAPASSTASGSSSTSTTTATTTPSAMEAVLAKPLADPSDQGVGAAIGIATGGRVTPGGLRITGHYLYQLSSQDWFDGTAAFTFGGGDPACFRDRMDLVVCQHGATDGDAIELAAGVRRMFAGQGQFLPFARLAIGLSYVRFNNDNVSGLAVPLHLGGGIRARMSPMVAIVGLGELTLGLGKFGRGLGVEPQLGLSVTAGVEFSLR
jgi:hypothetical protein